MPKETRQRLTDKEFNLVITWTMRTHFDSVMDVTTDNDGNDCWMDYENDTQLSLAEGFKEMAEAVAYPFEHEGFTEEEGKILYGLLEEFGVDEGTLEAIRDLRLRN